MLENAFKSRKNATKSALCAFILLLSIFFSISFSLNENKMLVERVSISENFEKKERQNLEKIKKNIEIAPLYISESPRSLEKMEMDTSSLIPNLAEMSYLSKGSLNASLGEALLDFEDNSLEIFEVQELDSIPKRIKNGRIKYPSRMQKKGIEGEVRLVVLIDENGNLSLEKVLFATNAEFEKEAISALKEFKYEAPLKMGKKVKSRFIWAIPFTIETVK